MGKLHPLLSDQVAEHVFIQAIRITQIVFTYYQPAHQVPIGDRLTPRLQDMRLRPPEPWINQTTGGLFIGGPQHYVIDRLATPWGLWIFAETPYGQEELFKQAFEQVRLRVNGRYESYFHVEEWGSHGDWSTPVSNVMGTELPPTDLLAPELFMDKAAAHAAWTDLMMRFGL